jgi:hypothetical protein
MRDARAALKQVSRRWHAVMKRRETGLQAVVVVYVPKEKLVEEEWMLIFCLCMVFSFIAGAWRSHPGPLY